LVSSLAHVAAVRLTTYEPLRDSDVPVGDRLSSVLREYRLRSPTPPDRVIDWVMNLHEEARRYTDRGETRHRGALEGRTEQHQNVTIDFDHTIHDYLGLTHDDIQRIDTGDLAADPIIIRLREKLFAEPLFTVRPGP
jgi:hypothetical protein